MYSVKTRHRYSCVALDTDPSREHPNHNAWARYGRNIQVVLECVYGSKEETMLAEYKAKRFEAKQRRKLERAQARMVYGWVDHATPWAVQPAYPAARVLWSIAWRYGMIVAAIGALLLVGHLL